MDSGIHGLRLSDVSKSQVFCERAAIELRLQTRIRKNRLDLGSEQEGPAVVTKIKGFDPQSVARHEQFPPTPVPDGECEHTTQMLYTVATVFFEQVKDCLSVTLSAIAMPT